MDPFYWELMTENNASNKEEDNGPWGFKIQKICDLADHTNLYEPNPSDSSPLNDEDVVPLPFDARLNQGQQHWDLIKEALSGCISSSAELETAIQKYNKSPQEFLALRHYLDEVLDVAQRKQFFTNTLPGIIKLVLRLPDLVQGRVPILIQNSSKSISLSQLQVASLLANAFLCTFAIKRSLCPIINFNGLFASYLRVKRIKCVSEKLRSICHYFERVIAKESTGHITFERKSFSNDNLPTWDNINTELGATKACIRSNGLIEDDADGLLQVDFANKNVGGGVLAYGCVQEEIRFIICPELIISRLFTEQLGPTEALIVTGAERYSNYTGYGDSYEWKGDYIDNTPRDVFGRRRTTIVAIDATKFGNLSEQYKPTHLLRELNKAYAGFYSNFTEQLPAVATGNWGCGAYRGDPKLKFLIQLMACNVAKRDMVYFTFNSDELSSNLKEMYEFLSVNSITIAQLWQYLNWFSLSKLKPQHLYTFIYYIHCNKDMYNEDDFTKFSAKDFTKKSNKRTKTVVNDFDATETIIDDLNSIFML